MSERDFAWFWDRAKHVYQIAIRPAYGVIVVFAVSVLLGMYQAILSVFVPPDRRGPWDIYNLLPGWQFGWYVLIVSVLVVLLILEGSYRYHRQTEGRLAEALNSLSAPPLLRLVFDDENPYFIRQLSPDGPPREIACVSVENISAKTLSQCKIRVSHRLRGWRPPYMAAKHSWVTSCPPFLLVPGDAKAIPIFWIADPVYSDDPDYENYISLFSFVEKGGQWVQSDGTIILVPGDYSVAVEALSADAPRASSVLLDVRHRNGRWVIRDAIASSIRSARWPVSGQAH